MALSCPACGSSLRTIRNNRVEVDICPKCRGTWFDRDELQPFLKTLATAAETEEDELRISTRQVTPGYNVLQDDRTCPRDGTEMSTFNFAYDSNVFLDRCPQCAGVWADGDEVPRLATYIKGNPYQTTLGEAIAIHQDALARHKDPSYRGSFEESVDLAQVRSVLGTFLPLVALPFSDDEVRDKVPYLTISFIAVNLVLFALTILKAVPLNALAVLPQDVVSGERIYSLFTHIFIHAGIFHFVSNMLYLWVFGDNIEDRLGHVWFVVFYLASGLFAAIAQVGFTHVAYPGINVPMVGASGAISGILGAYCILCPGARLRLLVWFEVVEIPAAVHLGLWFVVNLGYALLFAGPESTTAWTAHVGGFSAGLLCGVAVKQIEGLNKLKQC